MRYALLLSGLLITACGQNSTSQWALPKNLNEVSGLAASGDHHVLLHDDEQARVYELDLNNGAIRPIFQIDQPARQGDFEGIAVIDSNVFLIDSRGVLYQVVDGLEKDGEIVQAIELKTNIETLCEFEGLTHFRQSLLLLCKTPYKKADKQRLIILAYEPKTGKVSQFLNSSLKELGLKRLSPSGITTAKDELLIVAAKQHQLLRVSATGELLELNRLDKHRHRQPEGIALLADGRLFVADEGKGRGGRVTQFQP